ncbi:uncharacterized protein A1O9_00965 [Exophiala aquamarina CBS 119918]|uniref:Small ribosomal subunit protein mS35 mitochondrial conserved domain-containing protein n=1 Tax=Exophiala aquamarina CBS 119918 TaxID=1182545 RepID=A0A072Q4Z7_9EURO|nr:uncharacterized protein A1O9_00965 [Exophiala aquamarina CBS 119918]KEF62990.1 hypothetical protein A1O9_00965 [Exophiala aquamarina CBS 119918]
MATPTRYLCRTLLQVSRRQLPAKRKAQSQCLRTAPKAAPYFRQYSSASILRAGNSRDRENELPEEARADELERVEEGKGPEYLTPLQPIVAEEVTPEELEQMKELLGGKPGDPIGLYNHLMAVAESLEGEKDLDPAIMDEMERDIEGDEDVDFPVDTMRPREMGWFATDEGEDEFAMAEDGDDDIDDSHITSVAHSQLEVHREVREYTRVVAWDMPLLTSFAKEFKPPTESQPLRFRYTTYMGESHPAAKKVVVQFCTKDLPGLTDVQRLKLIKLVGTRYNPDSDMIKMSSEKFEAPAQNKRYLGDLVNKLIDEAKNGADDFKDIPLDLRHVKPKKNIKFPEEWRISPRRVQELLLARREQRLIADAAAAEIPVDGKNLVHNYVQSLAGRNMPTPNRLM